MRTASDSRPGKPSRRRLALFEAYLRWYLPRHFHGVRLAHGERFPREADRPLIVYLNHSSWWDPLACLMLLRRMLPKADHYAAMDEAALKRYRFFSKIGMFPVEQKTARGAVQFLRSSTQILSLPNSVLWLTPEGRFSDVRQRPPAFREGLANLLVRLPRATVLPLAIEYVFWDERLPEALLNCGSPIHASEGDRFGVAQWNQLLASSLVDAQNELAGIAMARDPERLDSLLAGRAGVGAFYDLWQRLRSASNGEAYQPEHGSVHRP